MLCVGARPKASPSPPEQLPPSSAHSRCWPWRGDAAHAAEKVAASASSAGSKEIALAMVVASLTVASALAVVASLLTFSLMLTSFQMRQES